MATGLEESKLDFFRQWLQVNGAQLRGCKIEFCSSSKRFGIFPSHDVSDGVLLVVPLDLAITPMRVLNDSLFGLQYRSMFEEGEVDDRFLIMLFLMVERLRKNSSWKPYLDMLPTEFGNTLWFTNDELNELKGTTLHRATELQKENLRYLFDKKVKKFAEKLLDLDGYPNSEVRFEDFVWANSIFWTRALNIPLPHSYIFPKTQPEHENTVNTTSKIVGASTNHYPTQELVKEENENLLEINRSANQDLEVEPASQGGETIWVEGLVPGIDFCNHDLKAAATWEVDGNGSTTGVPFSMYLISAGNLQAETEISISYGDKGNEIHYPMEAIKDLPFSETKVQLLEAQKGELRCILRRQVLETGFFPESASHEGTGAMISDNLGFSWSGQRKMPSYINKLVFPEDFLTSLRIITMKESDLYQVSSLLEELVGSEGERQPSGTDVGMAVWEICGDSGALQLLVDLLHVKMMELEEGSGTEENDAELLHNSQILDNDERSCDSGTKCRSMSRKKWSSIVYRQGQKQLARRFTNEAEQALQLAMSEGN